MFALGRGSGSGGCPLVVVDFTATHRTNKHPQLELEVYELCLKFNSGVPVDERELFTGLASLKLLAPPRKLSVHNCDSVGIMAVRRVIRRLWS